MKFTTDYLLKNYDYLMQIPKKFDQYVSRCKTKKIKFQLSFVEFDFLVKEPCWYCGFKSETKINGVDRLDPKLGYDRTNVAPSCWTCNRAKGNMSLKEYEEYLNRFKG